MILLKTTWNYLSNNQDVWNVLHVLGIYCHSPEKLKKMQTIFQIFYVEIIWKFSYYMLSWAVMWKDLIKPKDFKIKEFWEKMWSNLQAGSLTYINI